VMLGSAETAFYCRREITLFAQSFTAPSPRSRQPVSD
jgi:hypothetical protein